MDLMKWATLKGLVRSVCVCVFVSVCVCLSVFHFFSHDYTLEIVVGCMSVMKPVDFEVIWYNKWKPSDAVTRGAQQLAHDTGLASLEDRLL